MIATTIYSQRDPRWANDHLGLPQASELSKIGAYGCAITAIAQKLTLLGFPTTPPDVQHALEAGKAFKAYDTFNYVDWARIPIVYPQLMYNGREDYPSTPTPARVMEMIYSRLLRNDPVVIYVDASQYERGLQQHFVLAIGTLEGGDITIANPWNGQMQTLRPYGKTDPIAICGLKWLDLKFDEARAL